MVLIDEHTNVLVQGITGKEGSAAALRMRAYGTKVLCGVTPGKGGMDVEGIPVYNSVKEALAAHPQINCSMISVPPVAVKGAAFEAIENGIKFLNIMTEQIPIHDTAKIIAYAREHHATIVGPASVGIIAPDVAKTGFIGGDDNRSYTPGPVGIISKSGGMCSETALILTQQGIGQSTVVGIGGDTLIGFSYADALAHFEKDQKTKIIVMYGEIGGTYEEDAATFIKAHITKPVVAFICGKFASTIQDFPIGHAGAIIEGNKGKRETKIAALKSAGVHVVEVHHEIAEKVKEILNKS